MGRAGTVVGCVTLLLAVGVAPASAQFETTSGTALGSATETTTATLAAAPAVLAKIGPLTQRRLMAGATGRARFIVSAAPGASLSSVRSLIQQAGGAVRRALPLIDAQVVDLPYAAVATIAGSSLVARVNVDRRVTGTMERAGSTIGAVAARADLGYDGSGVGIAVIDSGITSWHDDLAASEGGQRVDHFVDFVNARPEPYDDLGHGTHVAGIIAGDGFDSSGKRTGIAPGARLVVLKVLDGSGSGYISDVIAALDYLVAHKEALNVRVANLSVAAGVHESYNTDPLTLAAKRAADAGIIVVAAAGNGGRNPDGRSAYGGITAPGNAPWVLTVGASSHMGTIDRADDVMAVFSSRGPTRTDYSAKPDLVAPGVGIESLSDPYSAFYSTKAAYLLRGTAPTSYLPYLSLSGTSMAAPVVSGTVALMLQANPSLTPNQVKAILQFTAQRHESYDTLTQGAGFLNARGAIDLARYFADPSGVPPQSAGWGRRLLWGNHLVKGGWITSDASAWAGDVVWGRTVTPAGQKVAWGIICSTDNCSETGDWDIWQADGSRRYANAVWGSVCNGADCQGPWTIEVLNDDDESVVWGTSDGDESVVWGTSDDESVVWGTSCRDSACEPVVWAAP